MNRTGVVIKIKEDRAVVQLLKHTACGDCGACHLGDDSKSIVVECENLPKAQVGEKVEIDLGTPEVLSAAFILYMIPMCALLIGIFGGSFVYEHVFGSAGKEGVSVAIGLLFMTLAYVGIKMQENRFAKSGNYLSKIVSVKRTSLLGADTFPLEKKSLQSKKEEE